MKFSYRARNKEGDIQVGFVDAFSKEAALEILQGYGLYATVLKPVAEPFWKQKIGFLSEASRRDVISFTSQLAMMLKSNIPLVESLETIASQTRKSGFREEIMKMSESIEGGSTLSQAVAEFPKIFSLFYIGMLKAGEISGNLPESLEYLGFYLEKEQDFVSRLIVAVSYPAFVLVVFLALAVITTIFIVPNFEQVFTEMNIQMPLLTRIIIGFSKIIQKWGLVLLGLLVAMVGTVIYLMKKKETKKVLDRIFLDIPLVGDIISKVFLARIALNLSTLVAGGVPISQSLEITSDLVNNDAYRDIILKTREGVRSGRPISSVLAAYPKRFPLLFVQMVTVGEKTGHMEKSLKNIVELYDKEVNKNIEFFIKLLEPVLIIILAAAVAAFAMGLFIPLFQQGMNF